MNVRRIAVRHPLATAVTVSLALHLAMMFSSGVAWVLPKQEIEFPIEARLQAPPPPPLPTPRPELPETRPTPAPLLPVADDTLPEAQDETPEQKIVATPTPEVPTPTPTPEPEPAQPPAAEMQPPPPPRQTAHELPERLEMRYTVLVGNKGFVMGSARYLWESRDGRYVLKSTAEPTGVAAMFIHSRVIQTSEGQVDAWGLKPDRYLQQRGESRQYMAMFDWESRRLMQSGPDGSRPLADNAQDLLSFPFHLTLTARAEEPEFVLPVTDGRKMRDYTFRILGKERLKLHGRELDTLHLQGTREGEGTMDVWLAGELGGLPVQIRTYDQGGRMIMLVAEALPNSDPTR